MKVIIIAVEDAVIVLDEHVEVAKIRAAVVPTAAVELVATVAGSPEGAEARTLRLVKKDERIRANAIPQATIPTRTSLYVNVFFINFVCIIVSPFLMSTSRVFLLNVLLLNRPILLNLFKALFDLL